MNLAILAEFSKESGHQISWLDANTLRIGTGNIFSRTGNFLAITVSVRALHGKRRGNAHLFWEAQF